MHLLASTTTKLLGLVSRSKQLFIYTAGEPNHKLESGFALRKAVFRRPNIMGNCVETSTNSHEVERKQENQEKGGGFEESGFQTGGGGGVRIKLVLTKEELEWLMLQLNGKSGKKLEDVLGEIERVRGKVSGWKPNLESIMEIPEVHEMDRSS